MTEPLRYPDVWAAHLPAGEDPAALDLTARRSLPAAWAANRAAAPERPVLHDRVRGWLTNGQLEAESAAVAARLHAAGLRPGDRFLMSAASSAELVVAHVAALRLGLVVVPTNTAYREREIAHIVHDADPAGALVDDEERAAWIVAARPGTLVVGPAVALPDAGGAPAGASAASPALLDAVVPSDPAILGYTSGTTGAPKGAVLSHGNLLASAEAVVLAWRWTAADRLLLCLPLFHAHGLCVGLHGTLLVGASAVLRPGFDLDGVLDAIAAHGATMFFGVPTMYHRFAASPRAGELRRLRLCVSGSAPLPADLHVRLQEAAGQRVLERYGMTETLMNVSNPHDGERRPGSVGLPLPGCEVRLAGSGESRGAEGEIQLRGPNVFAGYWRNDQATRESFTGDGWFRSGDLGTLDPDGYLRILGRAKELIISGGFNVYPREVEDVLLAHPAVAEAAVVGTPSAEWGEVVTAFVVAADPAAPPAEQELVAHCERELAAFKRPRLWHLVDGLPRNALGKVLKHELEACCELAPLTGLSRAKPIHSKPLTPPIGS